MYAFIYIKHRNINVDMVLYNAERNFPSIYMCMDYELIKSM